MNKIKKGSRVITSCGKEGIVISCHKSGFTAGCFCAPPSIMKQRWFRVEYDISVGIFPQQDISLID